MGSYRYAYKRSLWSRFVDSALGFFTLLTLGSTVLIAIVLGLVLVISRPVGRTTCANWSKQTGIRTKFEILSFFDTGTCLAQTPDGRWVKNTLVREYIPGR